MSRGVDEHRRGLEHLLPEPHDRAGGRVAAGLAGLADVHHAPAKPVRAGPPPKPEAWVPASGWPPAKRAPRPLGDGPGDHRGLTLQTSVSTRPGSRDGPNEPIRSSVTWGHGQHHQLGAATARAGRVGQLGDRGGP